MPLFTNYWKVSILEATLKGSFSISKLTLFPRKQILHKCEQLDKGFLLKAEQRQDPMLANVWKPPAEKLDVLS